MDAKFDSAELREKKEQLLYNGRMFKCHKCWYRVKDAYSYKRLIMLLALTAVYLMWIMPFQLYTLNVLDRHYFGYFDEREPVITVTTAQRNYFVERDIPHMTMDELKAQRAEHHRLSQDGVDPYKSKRDEYSLQRVAGRFLRALQGGNAGTPAGASTGSSNAPAGGALNATNATSKAADDLLTVKNATFEAKFAKAFLTPD